MTTPDVVLAPFEPLESQWSEFARDIVQAMRMTRPTGRIMHDHLRRLGHEIPEWFTAEIPNEDHVPPKGACVVVIYKACLAALPPADPAPASSDFVEILTRELNRAGVECVRGSVRFALAQAIASAKLTISDEKAERVLRYVEAEGWRDNLGPGGVKPGKALTVALAEILEIPYLGAPANAA